MKDCVCYSNYPNIIRLKFQIHHFSLCNSSSFSASSSFLVQSNILNCYLQWQYFEHCLVWLCISFPLISFYTVFSDLQLTDSGLYTCTASSESGETSWSASLTVEKTAAPNLHRMPDPSTYPSPPPQPHILNTTQSSVTVSWHQATKPKPGASPLIGYTVEYFSSDLQTGWVAAANRVTADTITVSLWAKIVQVSK